MGPIGRYVALAAALLAALWWAYGSVHHAGYKAGIAAQAAVDSQAMRVSQDKADKETARLQSKADKAEGLYAAVQKQLAAVVAGPPLTGSQLCKPAPSSAGSLPQGSPSHPGTDGTGPAAPVVLNVPASDNGQPYDRLGLLKALGALADHKNDALREWQAR
jgi:hypothetical protein